MRWRRKNKEIWVLHASDPDSLKSFPFYSNPGRNLLKSLILLNLSWNLRILENLAGEGKKVRIYGSKKWLVDVKYLIKTLNIKSKISCKSWEPLPGKNSLFQLFQKLIKDFNQVTLWNLESLVLTEDVVKNREGMAGCKNRLLLLKTSEQSNSDDANEPELVPSIYNMESIRDSILYMSKNNSEEFQLRSLSLTDLLKEAYQGN